MLNKKKAIRIEKQPRKSGGPRTVYIFKCKIFDCYNEIKARSGKDLLLRSGTCIIHSHRKKPFESIYNSLCNDDRNLKIDLTYDQFIEFTKIKKCHYCNYTIKWIEYPTIAGKFISNAYYLDRKDCDVGYSKYNCVVCCTRCNRGRSNAYTYQEWYGMTEYLRKKSL